MGTLRRPCRGMGLPVDRSRPGDHDMQPDGCM